VNSPFNIGFLQSRSNQNYQFAETRQKTRVVTEKLTELSRASHEFGTVQPDPKRPSGAAARCQDFVIEALSFGIQLFALQFRDAAHLVFSASHR